MFYTMNFRKALQEEMEKYTQVIPWTDFVLEDHQEEAMLWVWNALGEGRDQFSVVHSCGSWKTIVEGAILKASEDAKKLLDIDAPNVVLSIERGLIYSIREQLEDLWIDVWVWWAWEKVLDRSTLLCSIQALQHDPNQDISKFIPIDRVPLLIWDEADMYLTPKRTKIIDSFSDAVKIWLTATEDWPDGRDISTIFWEKVHYVSLRNGISKWINTPPVFYLYESDIWENLINTHKWEYESKSLNRALKEAEIERSVIEIYSHLVPKDRRAEFPTLAYVPSVDLVRQTHENFEERFWWEGLRVRSWTWSTVSNIQMVSDIQDFNNGEIDVLVLCEMGGRGIDLPIARVLIDWYPTLSMNKLEQRHWRVTRKIRDGKFEKPYSIIAQIIPSGNTYRPVILPDIICPEELGSISNGQMLGISKEWRLVNWLDGPSNQDEVIALRQKILSGNPTCNIRLIESFDTLDLVKNFHDLPRADNEGLIYLEGVKYATIDMWSKINWMMHKTTKKHLTEKEFIIWVTVWGAQKFYAEHVVRDACELELPKTNDNREIILAGRVFKTLEDWREVYTWVDIETLRRKLRAPQVWIKWRLGDSWNVVYFYTREQVSCVYERYDKAEYQADSNGYVCIDGEDYGTVFRYLTKALKISNTTIMRRIKENNLSWVEWKTKGWGLVVLYSLKEVENICSDLIDKTLPASDKDGFFEINEIKYWTISAWASLGKGTKSTIYGRQRKRKISWKQGRDSMNRKYTFYTEAQIDGLLED